MAESLPPSVAFLSYALVFYYFAWSMSWITPSLPLAEEFASKSCWRDFSANLPERETDLSSKPSSLSHWPGRALQIQLSKFTNINKSLRMYFNSSNGFYNLFDFYAKCYDLAYFNIIQACFISLICRISAIGHFKVGQHTCFASIHPWKAVGIR